MKSAFLLSFDPAMFQKARESLVARGATYFPDERAVQLGDEAGRLFTLYQNIQSETDFRDPPFVAAPGVEIPDMSRIDACYVECRWEEMFVELVREIAAAVEGGAWVLDSNDVVWRADQVDPARIQL